MKNAEFLHKPSTPASQAHQIKMHSKRLQTLRIRREFLIELLADLETQIESESPASIISRMIEKELSER